MTGKLILKEYHYDDGDDVVLTVLEGGEVMLDVDSIACFTVADLTDLANWILEKAAEVSAINWEPSSSELIGELSDDELLDVEEDHDH